MAKRLFGTDGIRGITNEDMNSELALTVGRAAALYAMNSDELPQIVIGKDTRLSGYMLEEALTSGITSMGLNVLKTGPLPTPGIGFITRSMRARLGVVISASHNPAIQNGIKIFNEDGFKIDPAEEDKIENIIKSGMAAKKKATPEKIGKVTQIHDAGGRYIQYLKETFPHRLNLKGMNIALDCANGAGYEVAPLVFSELGANIDMICSSPDGLNINDGCGALYPETICKFTKGIGADIGITLDGDADRVLLSDEKGNLVDGDAILYISAKHLNARGNLGKSTVVGTMMTNYGLDKALEKEGISIVRTDVGDHNVISYMRKHGINLGGESSGHLIYLHHSSTGDGILAALRILSIMRQSKKKLSELVKEYKPYPQKTINVHVQKKVPLDSVKEISQAKADIEKKLKGKGRLVLRYSGTEDLARVTIESNDKKLTLKLAEDLAKVVKKSLG